MLSLIKGPYESESFLCPPLRLKLINRWPLMRNVRTENVSEHSLQVAMVAHALAAIKTANLAARSTPSVSPCWRCTMTPRKY